MLSGYLSIVTSESIKIVVAVIRKVKINVYVDLKKMIILRCSGTVCSLTIA